MAMMRATGRHFNNDLPVVIRTTHTSVDPRAGELLHIAMIPLTTRWEIDNNKHILDLYIKPIKPLPEKVSQLVARTYKHAQVKGYGYEKAMMVFDHWVSSLKLGTSRIIPIGYNYAHDCAALRAFITHVYYESIIDDDEIRDIMGMARLANDLCDWRCEDYAYTNVKITSFLIRLSLEEDLGVMNALSEATYIQRIFVAMLQAFNRKMII